MGDTGANVKRQERPHEFMYVHIYIYIYMHKHRSYLLCDSLHSPRRISAALPGSVLGWSKLHTLHSCLPTRRRKGCGRWKQGSVAEQHLENSGMVRQISMS